MLLLLMRSQLEFLVACIRIGTLSLLESAGYTIRELVREDIFWSSGLSPSIAASIKSKYFPGANQLGSVMTLLRDELMKEVILSTEYSLDTFELKIPPPPLPPQQFRDDDVTSCDSASVVNSHRMSESDTNTSVSDDEISTDSSPVSIEDSCSGIKAIKPRDTSPNECDTNSMESHKDLSLQLSTSALPILQYKQLSSIVDSTKKNPMITRKVKTLRPIKKRGNLVQGTIRAAFDNFATGTPKRKMLPGKAADTDMDNKVPRSDKNDI